jgi:hypothetical protein
LAPLLDTASHLRMRGRFHVCNLLRAAQHDYRRALGMSGKQQIGAI